MNKMRATRYSLLFTVLCLVVGCSTVGPARSAQHTEGPSVPAVSVEVFSSDPSLADQVLALNPERIAPEDVSSILSRCPAPRIFNFNGSAFNTMEPFSRFLMRMGYPEDRIRDPRSGAFAYSSYQSAKDISEKVSAAYENEKLKPMLIGHSQGGAFLVKVLHVLKTPCVSFSAAIATGKWMRVLLGQWDMLPTLRKIPDTTEAFTGYRLAGDWIGSDVPLVAESGNYSAEGSALVRNIRLEGVGHLDITQVESLADKNEFRARIDGYTPEKPPQENAKLIFAADIWYHVKKHWCLELQNFIREHRQA